MSSSPEWFVTMTASFKGLSSVALGNIFGSNVINILLVLALTRLFYNFSLERQIARFDMPVLTGSILMLGLFSLNRELAFLKGLIFLGVFFVYLIFLFQRRKDKEVKTASLNGKFSLWKDFVGLILGFVILFIGSSLAVDSSLDMVEALSLSERFAGVFILSFSTSLPELATSLQAAFKKEGGMVLGNIVGSNIFNTLFVLGSASLINPLYFSKGLYYDYFFYVFCDIDSVVCSFAV